MDLNFIPTEVIFQWFYEAVRMSLIQKLHHIILHILSENELFMIWDTPFLVRVVELKS